MVFVTGTRRHPPKIEEYAESILREAQLTDRARIYCPISSVRANLEMDEKPMRANVPCATLSRLNREFIVNSRKNLAVFLAKMRRRWHVKILTSRFREHAISHFSCVSAAAVQCTCIKRDKRVSLSKKISQL